MVQQGVDQRAGRLACARMHADPGRLVDHRQMLVLVEDAEVDRFGLRPQRGGLGRLHVDPLPAPQPARRLALGLPVDAHPAVANPREHERAAAVGQAPGEVAIQAVARSLGRSVHSHGIQRGTSGPAPRVAGQA